MTERKEVRVTERVTIDVDPEIVETLRVAGNCGPRSDMAAMHNLADAIEAALPMPEPAVGSVVTVRPDGGPSVYFRQKAHAEMVWVPGEGLYPRVSWKSLRDRDPKLAFDGATLEAGR